MNNNLVKYNTVYSSKLIRKESGVKTFFKVAFSPCILIAWLVKYWDEQKENSQKIKVLEGEIQRLDLLRESQARIRRQQQEEQEQMTLEHVKKIIQKGNNVELIETKTYSGSKDKVKEWWLGGN